MERSQERSRWIAYTGRAKKPRTQGAPKEGVRELENLEVYRNKM